MLVCNTFEFDNRVFRAADTLQEAGFEVTLLAYHREGLAEEEILGSGFRLIRINFNKKHARGTIFYKAFKYFAFRNAVKRYVDEIRPDYVHCHDYKSLFMGFYAKKRCNSTFIYDVHEYFQDLNYLHYFPRPVRRYIARYERKGLKTADSVITVSPGLAEKLAKPAGKVINLVRNIPDFRDMESSVAEPLESEFKGYLEQHKGGKNLLFLGGDVSKSRGIPRFLEILKGLPAEYRLTMIGVKERVIIERLERLLEEKGVRDRVTYFHPLRLKTIFTLSPYFYMGLCLVQPINESYKHSLANKLFEYTAMGLPILASNIPDQKALLERYGNGLIIDVHNREESIERIISFSPKKEAGERALRELNWSNESKKLLELYR